MAHLDALDDAHDRPIAPPRYFWLRLTAASPNMLAGHFLRALGAYENGSEAAGARTEDAAVMRM